MKLSLSWIKDYVQIPEDMDLKKLAYDLTMSTVEVEDVEYLERLIREKFGITEFLVNEVGPTIGAHSGPGTLAVFFVGEPR